MDKKTQARGGIAIFLIAVVAVAATYLILNATVKPVQVVVAAQDMNAGTLLTADNLTVRTVPRGGLPDGTYSSEADLVGQTLIVDRVSDDPITQYVVGASNADSGIPAMLEANTVAIAIRVDQATGLAGVLRSGQKVTVIGIIDPSVIPQGQMSTYYSVSNNPYAVTEDPTNGGLTQASGATEPTATPQLPASSAARITISGLKVLVVPQSFRYEEVSTSTDSSSTFTTARTSTSAQSNNVILLQASILPVEIAPGVFASPAEILALLNNTATIHLVLEPSAGITVSAEAEGISLAELYEAITGIELKP